MIQRPFGYPSANGDGGILRCRQNVQAVGELNQGLSVYCIMGPIAALIPFNQSGFAQDAKMLGNGRLGGAQTFGKCADTQIAA